MLTINVGPYNPLWPSHFTLISSHLSSALSQFLPPSSYTIHHVGSTSVPSLAAKPIIDIDIVVPASLIMEAAQALTSHGYTYAYEPNGIDRMVFRYDAHALDSGASNPTEDGQPRRAVYLNKKGGRSVSNHLRVRDVLRRDAEMRERYGRLKVELAGEVYEDIGAYGAKKGEMIQEMLRMGGLDEEGMRWINERPDRPIDRVIQERRRAANKLKDQT
jgi:GrpB-like predicted nucleotidyltransferase (UPF0157 family)